MIYPTTLIAQSGQNYVSVSNFKFFHLLSNSCLVKLCDGLYLSEEPRPTQNCPRLNGYFGHKSDCSKFFYCVDGQFNMITCPSGLVFNPKTGICTWPDEAQKKGCSSEELFKFTCPKVDEGVAATHPRYADPEDCQFFYVCINGLEPRRNGCKLGQAFDDVSKRCNWARQIPEW